MKNDTHREAPDVPLSSIRDVPVYMFVAADDLFCPYD